MNQSSPLDGYRNQIETWLSDGKSYRVIAALVGQELGQVTSERSIRRAVRRWGLNPSQSHHAPERESFHLSGDEADFTTAPSTDLDDIDSLIRERGLDPEEWEVESARIAKWGEPGAENQQLRVNLKRKRPIELIAPARVSLGRIFPQIKHISSDLEPELVVFVGDQHAPYHDIELHKRFCAFLDDQQPERGVFMGDLLDLPDISRHAPEPDWKASTQECVNAGAQVVLDCKEASAGTDWVLIDGNHTERLRRAIIDRLADFYKLTPAKLPGFADYPPFHDPGWLLRLDEMGVEYIPARGSYRHAQYMVSPHLAAKHGEVARKGSGTSALATLSGLDHSVIMGHTHRQSLVQRTVTQIDGTGRLLQAAETGCMCQITEGLGYAPGPDWSNGFATASIWPDGTFKLDLATYVDSHLYWRSERY